MKRIFTALLAGLLSAPVCVASSEVLEKPELLEAYPEDGFSNEAVRFPERQAWVTFLQSVLPSKSETDTFSFLQLPWRPRKAVLSFENFWLRGTPPKFEPQESEQQHLVAKVVSSTKEYEAELARCGMGAKEVVYFNGALSDFIRKNELWNREGLRRHFSTGKPVAMPKGSIRLKTSWVKTDSVKDIGNFITTRDSKYQLWKLVSIHIASKQLPGWTWATFEHRHNPCFNKHLKAQDSFGYPYGPQKEYSKDLLRTAHQMAQDDGRYLKLLEVITNYRLVGTMTDFTDSYGRPNVLGSSVAEAGIQATSSCKTCHSRAALNASASQNLELLNVNGSPQWEWFFSEKPEGGLQQKFLQTDFIWSLPLCAAANSTSTSGC